MELKIITIKNKFMKSLQGVFGVILVGSLLVACGGKSKEKLDSTPNVPTVRTEGLKIAFYNQDSLLKGFDFYQELDSITKKKELSFQKQLESKEREIQTFAEDVNRRMNAGQLSQDQLDNLQRRGQSMQEALYKFQQNDGSKLEKETMESLKVISGKIKAAGKKYAQKHGLDILMADSENGSQFNYINPTMDVTKEFIRFINQEEEEINAIAKEK